MSTTRGKRMKKLFEGKRAFNADTGDKLLGIEILQETLEKTVSPGHKRQVAKDLSLWVSV